MEVLTQFLDAGGMAVIGAAIGAGLAYLLARSTVATTSNGKTERGGTLA